jgi:hypothetical protein
MKSSKQLNEVTVAETLMGICFLGLSFSNLSFLA